MKRTPLQRKTPLRARTPLQVRPLERGATTLPRATRIQPRSPRRQAAMVDRRKLVAQLLKERPVCEARWACRGARAVDVHERLKRSRGGNILDPAQAHMVTLCRACHELTESRPAEATRRRMLLPSWHVCPPVGPC